MTIVPVIISILVYSKLTATVPAKAEVALLVPITWIVLELPVTLIPGYVVPDEEFLSHVYSIPIVLVSIVMMASVKMDRLQAN
jgi:hypothetical protein